MSKLNFIKNKYSVSILILLGLLLADVLLHRGMSRVLLPQHFTDKIKPSNSKSCEQGLLSKEKKWARSINSIDALNRLPVETAGFESVISYDAGKKDLQLDNTTGLMLDSFMNLYQRRKLQSCILLNITNLNSDNVGDAMAKLNTIRSAFALDKKIIIESSSAAALKPFCDSGYFTSYRVSSLNPYGLTDEQQVRFIDSIQKQISTFPPSSLYGSYLQYPILKKFFPNFPLLTSVDGKTNSPLSYLFNRHLETETQIRLILVPQD